MKYYLFISIAILSLPLWGVEKKSPIANTPCGGPLIRVLETYLASTPKDMSLPAKPIVLSEDKSARYFSLMRRFWHTQIQLDRVDGILQNLVEQGIEPNPIDKKFLKFSRKTSDLLRQGFVIFDERGLPPRKLKKFTQNFGLLNDLIGNSQWPEAKVVATELRRDIKKMANQDFAGEFQPGIPTFHLFQLATHIRRDLKAVQGAMPVGELHEIRKQMKRFMNYFRVAYGITPTQKNKNIFDYLKRLNEDLGDINDEAVRKEQQDHIPYESQTVELPQDLKERILRFLSQIRWGG